MSAHDNDAYGTSGLVGTRAGYRTPPGYVHDQDEPPADAFDDPDDRYYGDEDAEIQAYPELQESRFYCKHGTYIGTPGGADYMCGRCESE